MTIDDLKARLVELQETGKAIQAKADAEKRDLNVDEQKEIEQIFNEFQGVATPDAWRAQPAARRRADHPSRGTPSTLAVHAPRWLRPPEAVPVILT